MTEAATLIGNKYVWVLPTVAHEQIQIIAHRYNLSFPIAHVLVSRGFSLGPQLDQFLFTPSDSSFADPALMKDSQKAVERILQAIEKGEKILVFGDYDVDGITSSALVMLCLLPLGANINFVLPHRVKDGYGLSSKIVRQAVHNNYQVIMTVDNGITAYEPAHLAKQYGIDLIITDHHQPHATLPEAYAIVNPHQRECSYPFKFFAGVGVIFKLMSLLYAKIGRTLPAKVYELLLLGTVADVVPLVGENRFWVRHGLQQVNKVRSNSLNALLKNNNVTKEFLSSIDIGFSVTPQINALGRLDDPRDGVAFLIGSNQEKVLSVAQILKELNETRRSIERAIFSSIEMQIEQGMIDITKERIIMASSSEWPSGVIGLVASRLVSAYHLPVLLFHITPEGKARGSCRSIEAFNIFEALSECADIIDQFGGHAHAAGLSLNAQKLPLLKERLEKRAHQLLRPDDLVKKIILDAYTNLKDLTKHFVSHLKYLEPFGHQNTIPLFYIKEVSLAQAPQLLKGEHVKCFITADGILKPVIFFNRTELFELLKKQGAQPFDIAVQVVENHWNGKVSIELIGIDVARLQENI